ncbi:toxin-antitoxin system YwqK family antitoxin [Thermoproteota archaeon]
MKHKTSISKRAILSLVIIHLFLIPVSADTIVLKSGKTIEGKITERTDEKIQIDIGIGIPVTYYLNEIESIDGERITAIEDKSDIDEKVDIEISSKEPIIELQPGETPSKDGIYKVSISDILEEGHSGWEERTYKDGKLNGVTRTYQDGVLAVEAHYKDDEFDGVMKSYYADGNLASEITNKEGKMNGWLKVYYESGALKAKLKLNMEKPVSDRTGYYEDGNVKSILTYDASGVPFSEKEFSQDGKIIKETGQKELLKEMGWNQK